ncbi:hypothetical protein [Archangium sp.]|uniref:hypothetical protein n=1 Tax=Archangium sp. TaxID=1872627 RepID=UPI002D34037E|nr:hypothetical protein [Archangium sp.]HYO54551.1 hypothetical protein [Archangium sp.]
MAQKSRPTRRPKGAPKAPGDEDNGRTGQAIPPRHPKGTPKEPGDEDLVIFTPDHRFYWVSRDDYRKPEHEFLPDRRDLYDNLLKAGVVLAQLPPLKEVPRQMGIAECVCFLVNLAGIRAQDAQKGLESRRAELSRTASARKKTSRASRKKT